MLVKYMVGSFSDKNIHFLQKNIHFLEVVLHSIAHMIESIMQEYYRFIFNVFYSTKTKNR